MPRALLPICGLLPAPLVREGPAVYRPRRPEKTTFYQLLETQFEEFALAHEERFEREDGPLRPVVRRVVTAFLACGRPENRFACERRLKSAAGGGSVEKCGTP